MGGKGTFKVGRSMSEDSLVISIMSLLLLQKCIVLHIFLSLFFKVFDSNEESGYLVLTIVISGHFFISQGQTLLVGFMHIV